MQASRKQSYGVFAVIVLAALLCGCNQTKISEITRNPVPHEGDEVTIAGKVTELAPDVVPAAYEVDDGTGQMWVVTEKIELPAKGSKVAVSGLVVSSSSQGPFNFPTVLQEMKRYGGGS